MNRAWRSISGHALEGEIVTRFVYLDESGISSSAQEPFLVMAGVIVNADKSLTALERRIETLADRFIPAEHRKGFIFHAKDLFAGEGPEFGKKAGYFDLEARLKIADELADIPRKLKLPISVGITNRAKWPQSFNAEHMSDKERRVGEHLSAFMVCCMGVEVWMRANAPQEVTMLIVEDNTDMRRRMKETLNAFRNRNPDEPWIEEHKQFFPFKKVKTSPLFEGKEDSVALQMADFCAYVLKRRAMQDKRADRFFSKLAPMLGRDSVTLNSRKG